MSGLESWLIEPLKLTLWTAVWTLFLHSTIGVWLAAFLSGGRSIFKRALELLITLPIVFPPIVIGLFLLVLLGKNGFIGGFLHKIGIEVIFTPLGVLIASFIAGLPLVVKPLLSALDELSNCYLEASYTLGKSRSVTLYRVLLPSCKKVIAASLILGLGRSMGEVGITLMLGGNIIGVSESMSLAIYNNAFGGEIFRAIVLSAILGVISLLLFGIMQKLAYKRG